MVKNEDREFPLEISIHSIMIIDGLTCIDMIKEFKVIGEQKNPYFKEACKYSNVYVLITRQIAVANLAPKLSDNQMEVDEDNSVSNLMS